MQTLIRYLLSVIVFVSLTTGPLCIDTQCSTEADACCGLEAEEISCIDDSCEDDHGTSEKPDDHCASCSHCSISIIVGAAFVEEQVVTSPLVSSILTEHTLAGWVSLPERPPSLV